MGPSTVIAKDGRPMGVRSNWICPDCTSTHVVEKQILKQVKDPGIAEDSVMITIMPGETVDKEFTTVKDVINALCVNLGHAQSQAARYAVSAVTSTPLINSLSSMTFGNGLLPLSRSHFFDSA